MTREAGGSADRLYARAKDAAVDAMGGQRAFRIAGPAVREAFVARQLLTVLYVQDDQSVPDGRVRKLLAELTEALMDDKELS